MVNQLFSRYVTSINDFQKNPIETLNQANGEAVAILENNQPAFYCLPSGLYEEMLDLLEDLELAKIAEERKHDKKVKISLEALSKRVEQNAL